MNKEHYNKILEIAELLMTSGWNIESIDFSHPMIKIKRFYAIVNIWVDLYENHISMNEEHNTSYYKRFEYGKESEINEIVLKMISDFRHENFKLTIVNRYGYDSNGHDKFDYAYFPNEKSLLQRLCDNYKDNFANETLYSLEKYETQYPNPAIKLIVERLKYVPQELKQRFFAIRENTFVFKLTHLEYKTDGNNKVLNELKEERTYYAFVDINDVR